MKMTDVKSSLVKHWPITAGCLVLLISIFIMSTSDLRARRALRAECGAGMDCACFANVVNNRLNTKHVRAFRAFLGSLKHRPNANILEFIDEASAREISSAIALCRPPVPASTKEGKKK